MLDMVVSLASKGTAGQGHVLRLHVCCVAPVLHGKERGGRGENAGASLLH